MRADVLLLNVTVYDGTGNPRIVTADVAIAKDRIVAVGPGLTAHYTPTSPSSVYDCTGLAIAPGLIDTHAHDDAALISDSPAAALLPKTAQGITTVITGNCGISLAPLGTRPASAVSTSSSTCALSSTSTATGAGSTATGAGSTATGAGSTAAGGDKSSLPSPMYILGDRSTYGFESMGGYVAALEAKPLPVNVGLLVGHATLRVHVMGEAAALARAASDEEIEVMAALVREMVHDGLILGVSSGTAYPVAAQAPQSEITALLAALGGAESKNVYATHLRNEADTVEDALEEAIRSAEDAGVSLVVSHAKAAGKANWGKGSRLAGRIAAAAAAAAEHNPPRKVSCDLYPYTASSTHLSAPHIRRSSRSVLAWSAVAPGLAGRDIMEAASVVAGRVVEDPDEAVALLSPGGGTYFQISEDDLDALFGCPVSMVGSDGLHTDAHPHPRLYGSHARVLGQFGVSRASLPAVVHKMTGLPAATFGLVDRGLVAPGYFADLVVFDPDSVADTATFEEPRSLATGIRYVFVNGKLAYEPSVGPVSCPAGCILTRVPAVHKERMRTALARASEAPLVTEVPVGAAFYDARDGSLVISAHNITVAERNASLHAELVALARLETQLGSPQALAELIPHLILYVTIEPCGMCISALDHLGIKTIFYGAANPRFGGATALDLDSDMSCVGGVLRDQAVDVLKVFYAGANPSIVAQQKRAAGASS